MLFCPNVLHSEILSEDIPICHSDKSAAIVWQASVQTSLEDQVIVLMPEGINL